MDNFFAPLIASAQMQNAVPDAANKAADTAAKTGGFNLGSVWTFLPIIVLFVVFYFFLIRPQKKKEKETKGMLDAIRTGDTIVTIGGIIGKIIKIKDDVITIEIGSVGNPNDKSIMRVMRWSVREVTKAVDGDDAIEIEEAK